MRRRELRWLMAATAVVAARPWSPALGAGDTFVVRDVRVFDGEQVIPRTSVLVVQGRITAVGEELSAPAGAEEVAGQGKTLLPGLIDAHAHARGGALREQLVFGVTTVLDMSTDPTWAAAMRREQASGLGLDRADLFSAGALATAPGGHGAEYGPVPTLAGAPQAQAFIDARIAEGSDYIKIVYDDNRTFGRPISTIDKPTLTAAIRAAHARGKLAVVHIGSVGGASDALEAGADGLAHLSPDRVLGPELVALAKRRGAFIVPTLSLNESLCGVASGASLVADPQLGPYLSDFSAENLATSFRFDRDHRLDFAAVLTSVARLREAGVPILAGTDAPVRGTAHGASLHRELELLVRAGSSPIEALRAATAAPARAFALLDRGRITIGQRADLLLVDGDPTTDIRATRHIVRIWKLGQTVDREGYRASLGHRPPLITIAVSCLLALLLLGVIARGLGKRLRAGPS